MLLESQSHLMSCTGPKVPRAEEADLCRTAQKTGNVLQATSHRCSCLRAEDGSNRPIRTKVTSLKPNGPVTSQVSIRLAHIPGT